jgi:hypothetical protein
MSTPSPGESSTTIASPSTPSTRSRAPAKNPRGRGQATSTWTRSGSDDGNRRARSALLLRTLARWTTPCGSSARQSVNVPPVSTQICQTGERRIERGIAS